MNEGMQISPEYQVEVLQQKLAAAAVREAMLEAAIQQLLASQPNHAPDAKDVQVLQDEG